MTKKHYNQLAQIINDSTVLVSTDYFDNYINIAEVLDKDLFVTNLSNMLKADNPKFDSQRFREALK